MADELVEEILTPVLDDSQPVPGPHAVEKPLPVWAPYAYLYPGDSIVVLINKDQQPDVVHAYQAQFWEHVGTIPLGDMRYLRFRSRGRVAGRIL